MTRDGYRTATAASVLLVAAIAAVISYQHILTLAVRYGQPQLAAIMLPLSIDGAVLTSSLAMLRSARLGISAPWLARGMLVLSVGATLACNVAYGLPHGWPGALLSGWPAVAFIRSAEVAISMSRRATEAADAAPGIVQASDTTEQPVTGTAEAATTAASHPLPVLRARPPARRHKSRSRRGGSLQHRQARRAELEAAAVVELAADRDISAAELARRIDTSPTTTRSLVWMHPRSQAEQVRAAMISSGMFHPAAMLRARRRLGYPDGGRAEQ